MFIKNIPGIMHISHGTLYSTQQLLKCLCLTVYFWAHIIQRRWKIQLLKCWNWKGLILMSIKNKNIRHTTSTSIVLKIKKISVLTHISINLGPYNLEWSCQSLIQKAFHKWRTIFHNVLTKYSFQITQLILLKLIFHHRIIAVPVFTYHPSNVKL